MPVDLVLRGYACPWNRTRTKGNDRAQLAPASVSDSVLAADLIYGSHEPGAPFLASAIDDTLEFWPDKYGLAFEARVHPATLNLDRMVTAIRAGRGCSVGLAQVVSKEIFENGKVVRRIQLAELVHIAIVRDPAYPGTACWLADAGPAALPAETRELARRWLLSNSKRLAPQDAPGVSNSVREAILALRSRPSLPDGKRTVKAVDSYSWPPGYAQ